MTSSLGRGRLLAVIPAYNEQGAIRRVAAGVREVLPEADVLVVDDGSSDRTMEEAEAGGALVVRHPFNLGIGATVQTGLRFACEEGYEIVFRLDGDGQHNPADLPMLHAALRENRVARRVWLVFPGHRLTMEILFYWRLAILCFRIFGDCGDQATGDRYHVRLMLPQLARRSRCWPKTRPKTIRRLKVVWCCTRPA